ncbi:MAG: glycoside hydrolase family 75 protein [Luteolibacter sp.]
MNASTIATVRGVNVTEDAQNVVYWTAKGSIDADGANGQAGGPSAYREDNRGLDANANAGWPNQSWRNVLIDNGKGRPLSDGNGNWFSKTTYAWASRPVETRYVDSWSVPYVVINPIVRKRCRGIAIGAKAILRYKGREVIAVCADVSGADNIGEISIAAAKALGIPWNPRTGGVDSGVSVELHAGVPAVINGETYTLQRA